MREFLSNFMRDETGAAAAEYVLILAIIGSAIAVGALALGDAIGAKLNEGAGVISGTNLTPGGGGGGA